MGLLDGTACGALFQHVVAHGKKRLADGLWIIMFPEGTRIPVGQTGSRNKARRSRGRRSRGRCSRSSIVCSTE